MALSSNKILFHVDYLNKNIEIPFNQMIVENNFLTDFICNSYFGVSIIDFKLLDKNDRKEYLYEVFNDILACTVSIKSYIEHMQACN